MKLLQIKTLSNILFSFYFIFIIKIFTLGYNSVERKNVLSDCFPIVPAKKRKKRKKDSAKKIKTCLQKVLKRKREKKKIKDKST